MELRIRGFIFLAIETTLRVWLKSVTRNPDTLLLVGFIWRLLRRKYTLSLHSLRTCSWRNAHSSCTAEYRRGQDLQLADSKLKAQSIRRSLIHDNVVYLQRCHSLVVKLETLPNVNRIQENHILSFFFIHGTIINRLHSPSLLFLRQIFVLDEKKNSFIITFRGLSSSD